MRHRSKKKAAEYVERRALVEYLLKQAPLCQACLIYATFDLKGLVRQRPSEDVHELIPRGRGGSITDPDNLLTVCRFPCHRRITDDPLEAEYVGLTLPGWASDAHKWEAYERRRDLTERVIVDEMPSWWDETKRERWLSRFQPSEDAQTDE